MTTNGKVVAARYFGEQILPAARLLPAIEAGAADLGRACRSIPTQAQGGLIRLVTGKPAGVAGLGPPARDSHLRAPL